VRAVEAEARGMPIIVRGARGGDVVECFERVKDWYREGVWRWDWCQPVIQGNDGSSREE
jgi:hypothetical protein